MGKNGINDIIGKFALIKTEDYLEYGVAGNDTVVIAGSVFATIDDDDNYKLLFVVCKVNKGKVEGQGIAVKRENLDILGDEQCEALRKEIDEQAQDDKEEAANEEA